MCKALEPTSLGGGGMKVRVGRAIFSYEATSATQANRAEFARVQIAPRSEWFGEAGWCQRQRESKSRTRGSGQGGRAEGGR